MSSIIHYVTHMQKSKLANLCSVSTVVSPVPQRLYLPVNALPSQVRLGLL